MMKERPAYNSLHSPHYAVVPCDHCGGTHMGISVISKDRAYEQAQTILGDCRQRHAHAEVMTADSNGNTLCRR